MKKIGFDNNAYLKKQSEHILERIGGFDNKLYLEFGGKLYDDYHASRVLPGFEPDGKVRLLKTMGDQAEIVIAINASDIVKSKLRGDLGIRTTPTSFASSTLFGVLPFCRQCSHHAVCGTDSCRRFY